LQAGVGVILLADPAFGFGRQVGGGEGLGLFTEGFVDGGFHTGAGGIGDGADGTELIAVQVAGHAVRQPDGREGVGEDLFLTGHLPVADFDGAEIHGGGGVRGQDGAFVLG
jgi:hypothetical protein